jgi:hypothetical protein
VLRPPSGVEAGRSVDALVQLVRRRLRHCRDRPVAAERGPSLPAAVKRGPTTTVAVARLPSPGAHRHHVGTNSVFLERKVQPFGRFPRLISRCGRSSRRTEGYESAHPRRMDWRELGRCPLRSAAAAAGEPGYSILRMAGHLGGQDEDEGVKVEWVWLRTLCTRMIRGKSIEER